MKTRPQGVNVTVRANQSMSAKIQCCIRHCPSNRLASQSRPLDGSSTRRSERSGSSPNNCSQSEAREGCLESIQARDTIASSAGCRTRQVFSSVTFCLGNCSAGGTWKSVATWQHFFPQHGGGLRPSCSCCPLPKVRPSWSQLLDSRNANPSGLYGRFDLSHAEAQFSVDAWGLAITMCGSLQCS